MKARSQVANRQTYGRTGKRKRAPHGGSIKLLLRETQVAELITSPPRMVPRHTSVEDLATLFANADLPGVVVVDDEQRAVGIVRRVDLPSFLELRRAAYGPLAHRPRSTARREDSSETTVADLMIPIAASIAPRTVLGEALALIALARLKLLPVVADERGRVLALLTAEDVMRWLAVQAGYLSSRAMRRRVRPH